MATLTEMLRQTSCAAVPTTDSKKHAKGGLEPGVRNRNAAMIIDGRSEVIFSLGSTEKCAYTALKQAFEPQPFGDLLASPSLRHTHSVD